MTATIIPNLTTFLEDLKSADLVGISMIPKNIGLRLDFTYGPEVGDVAIELYQIIHLVFSQPLNSEETDYCFWVGEVKLQQLSETVPQVLSSLSYPFTNSQHLTTPLIQFYLEGDICLEAICQSYKIFPDTRPLDTAVYPLEYNSSNISNLQEENPMLNGLLPEQKTIEKLESLLENPNSLTDEAQEFFREVAAIKKQSEEETLQEMMEGTRKYLEAINTEIEFKNNIPRDINKYVDKMDKLAAGIESCWDIFSEESRQYFRKIAYGFTQASSKCNGWQGFLIKFRLILPSIQQKEDLFGKYQKSFLIIPKAVARAIKLRKSKSTSQLWEKSQYLLNKATEIYNSEKGILLPYLNLGRTPEEQLEKNKPAMAWAKARMEEIKRKYNGKDLSL